MQEDHAFASRCVNDAKAAGQRHFTLSSGYLALASFLDSYSGSLVDEEDEDTPGTQQETEGE